MNPLRAWSDFCIGQAGASAALTGLIFVVLSFNFDHIVGDAEWLGRAASGLILLAQPLVYALIALFPAGTTLPIAAALIAVSDCGHRERCPDRDQHGRSLPARCRQGTRASLLAAGELASTVFGLLTAWVLLVEVRRIRG